MENNIFDGTQEGWYVLTGEYININEWLTREETNIVFKITKMINGEPTAKYFLSSYDTLSEYDLTKIYFNCTNENGVSKLLNEPYVRLSNSGLDYYLLNYSEDLWSIFFRESGNDINSEYSFGDQTKTSRKEKSERCFYLKTDNNKKITIDTNIFISIPSDIYNTFLESNRIPFGNIKCSVSNDYLLITEVVQGIYKNNLNEESLSSESQSLISSVTPESYSWQHRNSPDVSEDSYTSDISPLTSPERGGKTRRKLKKHRTSKTKKNTLKNKTGKLKKNKKNKRKSNKKLR